MYDFCGKREQHHFCLCSIYRLIYRLAELETLHHKNEINVEVHF